MPRRDKHFATERLVALPNMGDRNQKAKWKFLARCYNARTKAPGQHGGPITHAAYKVMDALVFVAGRYDGMCFPSYETIARIAGVARSTVAASIAALEDAGLLTWVHRLQRDGDRIVRASNSYMFRWLHRSESENQSQPAKQQSLRSFRARNRGHGRGEAAPSAAILASIRAELGPMRPLDPRLPPPPRLRTA